MTAESDSYQRGAAVRRRLLGEERLAQLSGSYQDPAMQSFIDVSIEGIFGVLWTRPGLDIKTRILVCVVSDAATGQTGVLPEHLRIALREGWTETELTEVLLHLIGYVGAPSIREAMQVASRVFAEVRAQHGD